MNGWFYNLGRRLGRAAVPAIRKSKWVWQKAAGDEQQALAAEHAFGAALAVEVRAQTPPARDPETNRLVSEIGRNLARAVKEKGRHFLVEVCWMEQPNAFALPGGFIFVSETLVEFCERQSAELAFVIGHEMAHILRGHAWDRMLAQAASQVASAVALRRGPLGQWLKETGFDLLLKAHSRDGEAEADVLGVRLAASAGYYPGGAVTLLRRLEKRGDSPEALGRYFATHPPAGERLAALLPVCRQLERGAG